MPIEAKAVSNTVVKDFLTHYVDDGLVVQAQNKLKMEIRSA
jgi:hypothetical protein